MKKIKKCLSNRVIANYLLLLVTFTLLEVLFRLIDNMPLLNIASLRIFLGLNILALLFGYILSFLPKIVNKIFNLLLSFIATIYGIVELGFHNFLGVYASIGTNTQLGAVSSYIKDFLGSFKWTFYLLIIPFIFLLVYYIFIEKTVSVDLPKRKLSRTLVFLKSIPVFLIIILGLFYYSSLKVSFMQDKLQSTTVYELFIKPTNASLVIRNFGYIGYGLLDLKEYFFPGKFLTNIEIDPEQITSSSSEEAKYHTIIDNNLWLNIINEETDEEFNTLNKYFISNKVSKTNQYTGKFAGKNLIMIMVESGSNILLNETYYPNINRLIQNSYTFTNNYSPRNICSTGNNEMSTIISLYSINNNCTANVYQNNTYFTSLFNLFNNEGYTTNSFHDYYDWYYDRNTIHKNMGSMNYYDALELDLDFSYTYGAYNTWPSDEELITKYLDILAARDSSRPFMSFITTVTSHQPYSTSSEYGDKYMHLFPDEYSRELKRYMSKLKVVDNALGLLLEGLENMELLEDTVIVLFADHYPYAIDIDTLNHALDYDASVDNLADATPLIIYSSELEKKEITQYTSYIDILPTIANLFNLKYDSRLYMGRDVLSLEQETPVIFIDGSWKNKYAFYNASTNKVHYYTQKMYSDEEILAINKEVRLKLEMSSLAIKENYFSYLEKKLNSYTTSN